MSSFVPTEEEKTRNRVDMYLKVYCCPEAVRKAVLSIVAVRRDASDRLDERARRPVEEVAADALAHVGLFHAHRQPAIEPGVPREYRGDRRLRPELRVVDDH